MCSTIFLYHNDYAEYSYTQESQLMAENVNNVVCVMETNFVLGKNGGHKPCGLGIKSIIVVSE